jgi:hypothetical protein
MIQHSYELVEKEIIKTIDEINSITEKLDIVIDKDFCPGNFIMSQVLITAMTRIGRALQITIPDSCYIFHDKKSLKQFSIKEATQKLIKEATHGHQ